MPRTKSSRQWLKEHFDDRFVKKAKQAGYRARSAFKLLELQEKDKLFQPGMTVIDLGAAPGGWSQVIKEAVGPKGQVIALDILPIAPLPGVECLQGDFRDPAVLASLGARFPGGVQVVVSDMAPNISGIAAADQAQMLVLAAQALALAREVLVSGGSLVMKLFQGKGVDSFIRTIKPDFRQLTIRKPSASRDRSSEIYLVAKGFKKGSAQLKS